MKIHSRCNFGSFHDEYFVADEDPLKRCYSESIHIYKFITTCLFHLISGQDRMLYLFSNSSLSNVTARPFSIYFALISMTQYLIS
jgi:hypothetical protein